MPKKLKQLEKNEQSEDRKFLLSNQDVDNEMSLLQMLDQDLLALKTAAIPDVLTNVIMGITSVLHKLLFQFREIQGELMQKAMLQDVSIDLTGLTAAVAGLKGSIGINSIQEHLDLWSALEAIEEQFSQDLQKLKLPEDKIDKFEKKISQSAYLLNIFGKRWTALSEHWIPLVKDHSKSILEIAKSQQELKTSSAGNIASFENLLNPLAPTSVSSNTRINNLDHELIRVSEK